MEVHLIDEDFTIIGWDERQFTSDCSTERVRKYRESKENNSGGINETFQKRSMKRYCNALDTDTDTEKNLVARKTDDCPHDAIISAYHASLPMLPSVRMWTDPRKRLLRARWKEKPERRSVDWWEKFFTYIASQCPHLTGNNDRNWVANLEWILKPANFVKILEGNYERRTM